MGTKVQTLAQAAGVECPNSTSEMSKDEPYTKCEHHQKCIIQLNKFMGWPG